MSKKFFSAVGCIALLASQLVHAEVQIPIPDSVNLLVVNSLKPKVEKGGLFGTDTLILPDGENQIVFKFQPGVMENDTLRRVYSDVIVAKFTAQDDELTFVLPEYRDLNQARNEINDFEWSLVDTQDNAIDVKKEPLSTTGVQLGRNFIEDVMDYNMRGGVAAITTGSVVAKSLPMNTQTKPDSENISQLKAWYLKANEQERKDFQIWLIDQK
ncbi:DUF2057 family protein [Vibrio algivorus]|uniref:UPF0319 protein GCM10007931_28110 n=1 Tax=Vibrio algivorus TaxID=1667024 RepID=A0ABQ6ESW9_9VIBR|nr:DUF2057 family protein [Vibrio algivorus]GLT15836.1 UPF0319 protein [Vibrio algivorus]